MMAKLVKLAAVATLALGMSSAWAQGVTHEGTVVDTMNGGGYTYVQIKEADQTFGRQVLKLKLTKVIKWPLLNKCG